MYFYDYRKLFMSLFFTKFVKLDPDPHSEKLLDPDPQKNECGSTALLLQMCSISRRIYCIPVSVCQIRSFSHPNLRYLPYYLYSEIVRIKITKIRDTARISHTKTQGHVNRFAGT